MGALIYLIRVSIRSRINCPHLWKPKGFLRISILMYWFSRSKRRAKYWIRDWVL